jgi:flavodoxin
MGKVLIVFYSYTGTSRLIAEALSAFYGWPVGEVRDQTAGRSYLRSVLDSLLRRRPPVHYAGPPPQGFDCLVLVSPIWVGRLAGPMRSFVSTLGVFPPQVAVISAMGGGGAVEAERELGRLLGHPPLLTTACVEREVRDGSYSARLKTFADAVQSSEATRLSPTAAALGTLPA